MLLAVAWHTCHYASSLLWPAGQTDMSAEVFIKCQLLPSKLFYTKQTIWKRSITCNENFNATHMCLTIYKYWLEMGKERMKIPPYILTTMILQLAPTQAKKASLEAVWPPWWFRLLGEKVRQQDARFWGKLSFQRTHRQQKLF